MPGGVQDRYETLPFDAVSAPGTSISAVTTSDTVDLPFICKALLVTGAGTVKVLAMQDSTAVDLGTWGVTQIIPIRARRVFATGTTATLVALY